MPANFQPLYPYREAMGAGESLRDEKLAPFPRTEQQIQVHRQEYYAIITHMDAQIGRILAALEASGKADNTWVFFTADHGLAVGQHGLMGLILYPAAAKARLYDLQADPQELHDLADQPESLPLMKQLYAEFQQLQQQTNDTLDLDKTFANLLP